MTPASMTIDESDPAQLAPRRPDLRFVFAHPAHFIALGMGSGLSRLAPGTAGTLWAWALYLVAQRWMPEGQADRWTAAVLLLGLVVGWWACEVTARHLRVADPGCIVWDEILAFWLVLWIATPLGFAGQVAAFVLFRYFDAAKPGPVRWADSLFKGFGARGAFGILFDDLVAAFCTLLVLAIWSFLW